MSLFYRNRWSARPQISQWILALLWCCPPAWGDDPPPHVVFPTSRYEIDAILKRPYGPDVPMGCVGERLWASSPQGWAFPNDVHWLYLTNINAFDLDIRDGDGPLGPKDATYYPSHVHLDGVQRAVIATASFTHANDSVRNPLAKPFRPERRWTCWGSKNREDWFAVNFGMPRGLRGLKLHFYDDAPRGGTRPPAEVWLERRVGAGWKRIVLTEQFPARPTVGENRFFFDPIQVEQLRVVMRHADKDQYSGIYGWDPVEVDMDRPETMSAHPMVKITGDKFIAADDCLISIVRIENPDSKEVRLRMRPDSPLIFPSDQVTEAVVARGAGGRATMAAPAVKVRYHGRDVAVSFFLVAENFASLRFNKSQPGAPDFDLTIQPGRTANIYACMAFADAVEDARRVNLKWLRGYEPALAQAAEWQQWFDGNLAYFDCSDPWLAKMYYHRGYLLRKNLLDPKLGRLNHKALCEGRWRSTWYPNVISYGAAHQIREARWLRDRSIWTGQLRTFLENLKRNGVTPAQVKPSGPTDWQYADWIASTAWDGHLVHPDRKLLAELAGPLAANVRGWQKTYDDDGDGLLWVDSHWWTGMEWQPSFFAFCDFQTDPKDVNQPRKREKLDRVDLTSYNYGNAVAVARVYRDLGKPQQAAEFEALATKIQRATLEKMWDPSDGFFYSRRTADGAKAAVKEVVGVYPFYFDLPPAGKGYERAWESIVDSEQFWTAWPVASASKKCKAYSQDRWPTSAGGGGCMWNGPTWPHANSIVLTAMANTLRRNSEPLAISRDRLWELFYSFTQAQYLDQRIEYPWTGEFYNGDSGRWKTNERDYNHSTWLDILIPEIVGLRPRNDDKLVVDSLLPIGKLDYFILDGQQYRGHDIAIVWDSPSNVQDRFGDGRRGLDVYVDRKLVASAPSLQRLEVDLPKANP